MANRAAQQTKGTSAAVLTTSGARKVAAVAAAEATDRYRKIVRVGEPHNRVEPDRPAMVPPGPPPVSEDHSVVGNFDLMDVLVTDLRAQMNRLNERLDPVLGPPRDPARVADPCPNEGCGLAMRQAEQFRAIFSLTRALQDLVDRIAL